MTEMPLSKKTWNGETGRINKEMLSKYLNDLRGPIYYIAGPPAMVSGLRKMCWLHPVSTKTTSELKNLSAIEVPNKPIAPVRG